MVSGPLGKNAAEPELLSKLASYDASCIAAQYGLTFPSRDKLSQNSFDDSSTTLALAILAAQNSNGFINCAAEVGEALWSGDSSALDLLAAQYGCSSAEETAAHLKVGNIRRNKLGIRITKEIFGHHLYNGSVTSERSERYVHAGIPLSSMGAT